MFDACVSLLTLVALVTVPSLALAQPTATDAEVTLRIEGQDWIYWPHAASEQPGRACASPCDVDLPRGEIAIDMAAPTEWAPQHRRMFDLNVATTLRMGRWSHEGERLFGTVFLIAGGAAAIAIAGVGAVFGGVGFMIMGPTGAGLLALVLAIGIPFVVWSDEPTLEVTGESQRASRSQDPRTTPRAGVVRATGGPGDVGVGLAISL